MKKIFFINLFIFAFILTAISVYGFIYVKNGDLFVSAQTADTVVKDTKPPLISDIKINDIQGTSTVISWNTDEMADSLINFGLDKNYGIARDPRFDKLEHKIILEDLMPGFTYYFRITSSDESGNQGISSDYFFSTTKPEEEKPKEGYAEEVMDAGKGGLSKEGDEVLKLIENITSEQVLKQVEEKIQSKAEEIIAPPTIILDYADVEVGVNYAIITWETDKESNSIVALARESDFKAEAEDPYTWKEGEPEEMVLKHRVEITGLTPSTVYHFQVSSKSSLNLMGKSSDKTFKTKSILPEISNIQISKVEEESATIKWQNNVPCSAIIEYTNLNTSQTKLEGNSSFLTLHSMRLSNLIFDTYYSFIIKVESEDGEKAQSDPMTFITIRDKVPPVIAKVNTEATLYPGSDNKVQTIVSWATDEGGKCQLFYHQGLVVVDEANKLPMEEEYGIKHVQVVTNFLPSTVYKFWIECTDEANNKAKSDDFTMLTPSREESIIDIILKNFESSFGWVKKVGGN